MEDFEKRQHGSVKKHDFGVPITRKKFFNENLSHNPISFLLSFVGVLVMLYIGMKYLNDPDPIAKAYAQYSLLLCVLGLIGYMFMDAMDDGIISVIPQRLLEVRDYVEIFFKVAIMSFLIVVIQFYLQFSVRFALADYDMVLYFVFAGVCEELFFRAFLIGGILEFCKRTNIKTNKHILRTIAVLVSSSAFMLAHWEVYGNEPALFWSTFFAGLVFGFGYAYWKDLSANQMSHMLINILAVRNILVTY